MTLELEIEFPALVDSPSAKQLYGSVHLNTPTIANATRPSVLLVPEVMPGMTGFDKKATVAERCRIIVDIDALYKKIDADASVSTNQLWIRGLYSALLYRKDPERGGLLRRLSEKQARSKPNANFTTAEWSLFEVCVAVHLLTPVRTVSTSSVARPEWATAPDAGRCDEFETQLGEASISLWQLVEAFLLGNKKRIPLDLLSNGSGAIHFLKQPQIHLKLVNVLLPSTISELHWRGAVKEQQEFYKTVVLPAAKEFEEVFRGVTQGYASSFGRIGAVAGAGKEATVPQSILWARGKEESSSPSRLLFPHRWSVKRSTTYLFDIYGKPESRATTARGITVPIWYYLATRSISIFHAPPVAVLSRIAFMRRCMAETMRIYNLHGESSASAPFREELFDLLKKSRHALTDRDRTTLVALGDIIASFLTMPGWMSKYHSDIGFDANTREVTGSESLDNASLASFSASDDCEGKAVLVKEFYVQFICMYAMSPLKEPARQRDTIDKVLVALAAHIDAYFDLYSVTVTVSGSGIAEAELKNMKKLSGVKLDNEEEKVALDLITRTRTGQKHVEYDHEEQFRIREDVHEFCMLMPVKLLYEMAFPGGSTPTFDDHPAVPKSALNHIREYYHTRLGIRAHSELQNAQPWMPPAVILEGTWPTSSMIAGPSLWSFPESMTEYPTTTTHMTEFQKKILLADEALARFSKRARVELPDLFQGWTPRLQAYGVYRKIAGFTDVRKKKFYASDPGVKRHGSSWYKSAAHGVNIRMLEQIGGVSQQLSALAHTTFVNGRSMCYSIPIDDFLLAALPRTHPDGLGKVRHELAHPLLRVPGAVYDKMDQLEKVLRHMERQPPVNIYSVEFDTPEKRLNSSKLQTPLISSAIDSRHTSLAERILKTRFLLIDTTYQERSKEEIRDKLKAFTLLCSDTGAPVQRLECWDSTFFSDFCRPFTFVAVQIE